MLKKQRKNLILQRIDYIREKNNDPYLQLCDQNMKIDVYSALKMSILDDVDIQPYKRNPTSKHKNKPKLVIEQINKYLKDVYHYECFVKEIKHNLKPLIIQGQLCDSNFNWVLLELSGARVSRKQNPNVFEMLLQSKDQYPEDLFESIMLDVVRTIPIKDKDKKQKMEKNIEKVLVAYAIRNPVIGYCQGQNFIVNFLVNIQKFDLEDAFWIYTQLLENHMPLDYYTNIISVLTDQKILEYYLQQYLPDLNSHFIKIGLQSDFFTVQWYLCIFTNQINHQLSQYIILMLLLDGIKALTISSLILLMILRNELLKFKQFTEALSYIQTYTESYCDVDVFRHYYNCIKIQKKQFNYAREEIRTQLMQKHESRLSHKQLSEIDKIPPCPLGQPICNQVQLSNQFLRKSPSFFVYRQQQTPNVIPDYFNRNIFPETQKKFDLLVLRQEHICGIEQQYQSK